jgi:hypothetical protein
MNRSFTRNQSALLWETLELRALAVVTGVQGSEATVRWIGILGIFAALAATSADAQNANRTCLFEEVDARDDTPAGDEQPFLRENRCEAIKSQEFRVPLMRIPQEDEDPMELSFGVKNNGGMLRLKIPFSF